MSYLPLIEESAFCAPCHLAAFWDEVIYSAPAAIYNTTLTVTISPSPAGRLNGALAASSLPPAP